MPQPKELPLQGQRFATEPFRGDGRRELLGTQQVSGEMRPTELALGRGIRQVRRQPVAAEDAGKGRAEQALQDISAARGGNGIEHERGGDKRPEPAFRAVGPVPGLVPVEHRLARQRVLQFLIRRGDRRTRLFPRLLRTPDADRNLQRAFEQALHDQARQATHDGEIRNQRGELRSELADEFVGQGCQRGRATGGTLPPMTAVLGNVRGDRRQLRDLMPSRIADAVPRVQAAGAVATRVRDKINDRIHALDRHQLTVVPGMPRLTTGLASTLHAPTTRTLSTGEAIR